MDFDKINFFEDQENNYKKCRSKYYNYNFNTKTGFFTRWGKTYEEDPIQAPSPEILDIEISTICNGIGSGPCPWCYKSNTNVGENMAYEKFKAIFHKITGSKIKIHLENGHCLELNPDQKVLLKNGIFKNAENLTEEDILDDLKN